MCTVANVGFDASCRPDAIGKRDAAKRAGWSGRLALQLVLALAIGWLIPAHASTGSEDPPAKATLRQAPRHQNRSGLEDRVATLSKALDLDAKQQSELRKLLESQREQIRKVWSDTSAPAAYRVIATRAISDKTADQIRALLNDEQKKKYKPPRQAHEGAPAPPTTTVEDWMKAADSK